MGIFNEMQPGDLLEIVMRHPTGLSTVKRGKEQKFDAAQFLPGTHHGLVVRKDWVEYREDTTRPDPEVEWGHEVHILIEDELILVKQRMYPTGMRFRIAQKSRHATSK